MRTEEQRQYHAVANIFPLMSGEEYEALKADIAANGQIEPIWLHPDGSIIDGRNRYRVCMELGIAPTYREWDGGGSLVAFVASLNLNRRHLDAGQRAMIGLAIKRMLEEEIKVVASEKKRAAALEQWHGNDNEKMDLVIFDQIHFGDSVQQETRNALAEAGKAVNVSKTMMVYAQAVERHSPELAERVKAGEVKLNAAYSELRRFERVQRINAISHRNEPLAVVASTYPVIYADPPWQYEHTKTENRAIENHYPTMTLQEICDLPVSSIAGDDAVLFLWTTSPKLAESMQVISAWGFVYRTCIVWDKCRIGMGYYARQQHELLLIAARGALPVPEPSNRPASVIRIERDQEHSVKPVEFYEVIERMYPEYGKVELFARNRRDGWDAWGNQA